MSISFSLLRFNNSYHDMVIAIQTEFPILTIIFFQFLLAYLNHIKLCVPLIFTRLIFAQLNNSYICSRITFAHCHNLYFRVGLCNDWKYLPRQCMKCVKIRAFSDPYSDRILSTYGKIRIRESLYFGIFYAAREQELDAN